MICVLWWSLDSLRKHETWKFGVKWIHFLSKNEHAFSQWEMKLLNSLLSLADTLISHRWKMGTGPSLMIWYLWSCFVGHVLLTTTNAAWYLIIFHYAQIYISFQITDAVTTLPIDMTMVWVIFAVIEVSFFRDLSILPLSRHWVNVNDWHYILPRWSRA